MSRIINTIKSRRSEARSHRAIARSMESAGSPAMRDELIVMAQRPLSGLNR